MAGHIWPEIFLDVLQSVLSLNVAKSATLCSFVQSEGTDKTAVYPKERDKQIGQFAALSRRWKGCYQFQLNIKQRDLKARSHLIEFKRIQTIKSSSPCLVPLQHVNAPRIEWPLTMGHIEGPGTAINDRERHEWPWMAVNDHKWRRGIPWTSHVLSLRFVLHHLLQFPLILAKKPHSACNCDFHTHTHMNEHISASIFHIWTAVPT